MAGQLSPLERKSIEPIALAVEDGNVRTMQRFISDAPWDDDRILAKYRSLVNDDLGSPDGVLIFDESGFVKKGLSACGPACARRAGKHAQAGRDSINDNHQVISPGWKNPDQNDSC